MTTLDRAEAIAAATLEHGRSLGAAPLTVAVLDAGGHLVVLKREDGSGILRPQIAYAKAWGALGMGFSSRELGVRAERQPIFFGALASVADGRLAPAAGGVLMRTAEGTVVGAVGVSGDISDVDEVCALAGVAAAGLRTDLPPPGEAGSGGGGR
jgi:uncharacterized protein GlcG (DUF336 family)